MYESTNILWKMSQSKVVVPDVKLVGVQTDVPIVKFQLYTLFYRLLAPGTEGVFRNAVDLLHVPAIVKVLKHLRHLFVYPATYVYTQLRKRWMHFRIASAPQRFVAVDQQLVIIFGRHHLEDSIIQVYMHTSPIENVQIRKA